MSISRRHFLQGAGLTTLSLGGSLAPLRVWAGPSTADAQKTEEADESRALVLVQLAGGNDGLNTVVPLDNPLYKKLRPNIGLATADTLPLQDGLGLHNAMSKLHERFHAGEVAIVQGVGYPQSSRSHFESTAVWQTARENPHLDPDGWLGRARESAQARFKGAFALLGVGGGTLSPSLSARDASSTSLASLDAFAAQPDKRFPGDAPALLKALKTIYSATPAKNERAEMSAVRAVGESALQSSEALRAAASRYQTMANFPKGGFGDQLKLTASLLAADLGVRVVHLTLGGFDTHANQKKQQATLLGQLSDGVTALLDDLKMHQLSERVVVMTYSEFGRRVSENGSGGTDHGAASVLFLAGEQVSGGLHGTAPDLNKLDGGDIAVSTDFRSIYASVLHSWLGLPHESAVGKGHAPLPLFKS
jgi:uncharacterized protein (DUF1501 family)